MRTFRPRLPKGGHRPPPNRERLIEDLHQRGGYSHDYLKQFDVKRLLQMRARLPRKGGHGIAPLNGLQRDTHHAKLMS